jgi:hypothetical protein
MPYLPRPSYEQVERVGRPDARGVKLDTRMAASGSAAVVEQRLNLSDQKPVETGTGHPHVGQLPAGGPAADRVLMNTQPPRGLANIQGVTRGQGIGAAHMHILHKWHPKGHGVSLTARLICLRRGHSPCDRCTPPWCHRCKRNLYPKEHTR